jgi:hypothetical protein
MIFLVSIYILTVSEGCSENFALLTFLGVAYRLQTQRQPSLKDQLANWGRAREIALGLG